MTLEEMEQIQEDIKLYHKDEHITKELSDALCKTVLVHYLLHQND